MSGAESVINRGWIRKDKIRNFKHTANSVSAVGDDARHGTKIHLPPQSPMSFVEAESLITHLLKNWLGAKQK